MKKYFIALSSSLLPFIALANGSGEEDTSIIHQLEEVFPLEHLEHGHWVAVVVSVILWLSLVYTVVSLIRKLTSSQNGPAVMQ